MRYRPNQSIFCKGRLITLKSIKLQTDPQVEEEASSAALVITETKMRKQTFGLKRVGI